MKHDIEDYYVDCAGSSIVVGDRRITNFFTPYGIKCLDSEYSRRIRNINKPVVKLIKVDRNPHYFDGSYRSHWWDDYTELPLNEDFHSYDRAAFIHDESWHFRELEDKRTEKAKSNGYQYQQFELIHSLYTYTHPTYSAKHKGEDPKALRKEIKENPHLHPKIKENLLHNLKTYLNERNQEDF